MKVLYDVVLPQVNVLGSTMAYRCFGIARFPVRHGRTQNIHLVYHNVIKDFHYLLLGLENTVSKTMSLKRSSAAGVRLTFLRRISPPQEASKKSAISIRSKDESIFPIASASVMHGTHRTPPPPRMCS